VENILVRTPRREHVQNVPKSSSCTIIHFRLENNDSIVGQIILFKDLKKFAYIYINIQAILVVGTSGSVNDFLIHRIIPNIDNLHEPYGLGILIFLFDVNSWQENIFILVQILEMLQYRVKIMWMSQTDSQTE
jgi:hypothetical protein